MSTHRISPLLSAVAAAASSALRQSANRPAAVGAGLPAGPQTTYYLCNGAGDLIATRAIFD
jgi:hypothetical protein